MNCSEVVERLPWLLNQGLGADERATALAHLRECAECRAELNETQELLRAIEVHPAVERLVSYVFSDAMDPAERAAIHSHLAGCIECRTEVELARESKRALPAPRSGLVKRWRVGLAAAGVLTVSGLAVAAMAVWRDGRERVAALEQQVRSLREPVAGARLVDLLPRGGVRERSSDAALEATAPVLPANVESTLILNSQLPLSERLCAIRLLAAGGGEPLMWSADAVARGSNGEVLLRIPGGFLQPGEYATVLRCGQAEERYEFRTR